MLRSFLTSSQMQASQVQNREFLLVIVATNDTVCRKEAQIKAHQNLASSKHSHSNDIMSLQQLMPHVFGLLQMTPTLSKY